MLERIEESADQIIVLKAAVEFYLKHLKARMARCARQVGGLPEGQKQLESLLSQGNRAELEIQALERQCAVIEKELEPLKPYLTIINKVEELEREVREKEKLAAQKEATIEKERKFKPQGGKFVQEGMSSIIAALEHEKLMLEVDANRLSVDRGYQLRRLKELKTDRDAIKKKERDIQLRVRKVTEIIEQKRGAVDTISKSVAEQKKAIEVAQPADIKLGELTRDCEYLVAVTKIIDRVSLNAEALLEQAAEPVSA